MTQFEAGDVVALPDNNYWYRQDDGRWLCLTARGSMTPNGQGLVSLSTDDFMRTQEIAFVVRRHRVDLSARRIPEYGNAPAANPPPFGPWDVAASVQVEE